MLAAFDEHLRRTRGVCPGTRHNYARFVWVAPLSGAYRTPLHLRTCQARLAELTSWLNWLTALGIATLAEVNEEHCQRYFAYRRQSRDKNGTVVADLGPATRVRTTLATFDLINYRELFTSDRVAEGLRPWAGASPSAVVEVPNGRGENKTPPVSHTVLQPLLASAFDLINTLGPHAAAVLRQARQASRSHDELPTIARAPIQQFAAVLAG